ncbi:haloacid dehalogenase type II [Halegenticoccus tardaugens]|uniref:haloacid dehalogenase type II n=1 Tax=Halegenticoccus tardaugens TaxID=2071624 RepID=UPI00100B33B9|nr:haloacid dehalogenase type II [Halegenticoccus tardaugens]
MDPEAITTITVDSYSTLVDVNSQEDVLNEYVDGIEDAENVSQLWRSQYILYSVIANDIDGYRPFWDLIGQGLRYALEAHGHDVSAAVRDEIQRTVYEERLAVFEDVTDGIDRLADAGYDVYVVSNGTPRMLEHLLAAADLEGVVTDAVSADEVETYKPNPVIYRHAAERTATPIDEILHVSGGTMRDVWGAKHAGMRTAWLSRPEQRLPHESLGPSPDLVVEDFHDLADRLA